MFKQVCAAALAGVIAVASPARSAVVNQWVQFAPDDTVLIRAIADTPANGCPTAALTRGNHESCNRGAHGWFRLLDVHAYDQGAVDCTGPYVPMVGGPGAKGPLTPYDYMPPYVVQAGQISIVMFDSSDSNTSVPDLATKSTDGRTLPQIYTDQLRAVLAPLADKNVVYVTHKATYDIRPATVNGDLAGGDATQQSVFDGLTKGAVPAQVKLLVSGHDHQFQVVAFQTQNYAPQLVVGNSGTLLDNNGAQPQAFVPDAKGANFNAAYALPGVEGTPAIAILATADRSEYGFTVLDAFRGGYVANVHNLTSNKLARCAISLQPRSMLYVQ